MTCKPKKIISHNCYSCRYCRILPGCLVPPVKVRCEVTGLEWIVKGMEELRAMPCSCMLDLIAKYCDDSD